MRYCEHKHTHAHTHTHTQKNNHNLTHPGGGAEDGGEGADPGGGVQGLGGHHRVRVLLPDLLPNAATASTLQQTGGAVEPRAQPGLRLLGRWLWLSGLEGWRERRWMVRRMKSEYQSPL
jgi:hypothetical protein